MQIKFWWCVKRATFWDTRSLGSRASNLYQNLKFYIPVWFGAEDMETWRTWRHPLLPQWRNARCAPLSMELGAPKNWAWRDARERLRENLSLDETFRMNWQKSHFYMTALLWKIFLAKLIRDKIFTIWVYCDLNCFDIFLQEVNMK